MYYILQNKLLALYFELKLEVRRIKNISLTEICRLLGIVARSWFQPLLWDVLEVAVSSEVVGVRPLILWMSVRLRAYALFR